MIKGFLFCFEGLMVMGWYYLVVPVAVERKKRKGDGVGRRSEWCRCCCRRQGTVREMNGMHIV
jgi:hypothetical protein